MPSLKDLGLNKKFSVPVEAKPRARFTSSHKSFYCSQPQAADGLLFKYKFPVNCRIWDIELECETFDCASADLKVSLLIAGKEVSYHEVIRAKRSLITMGFDIARGTILSIFLSDVQGKTQLVKDVFFSFQYRQSDQNESEVVDVASASEEPKQIESLDNSTIDS